ncbi:MAG: YIP1 family protein [Chitinophagales bacterium]|nr:YIP1 family protein [Chitinophagales bacterium]
MNLIERAKNIMLAPNKEWDVINGEEPNTPGIITGYVLPLAGAAAVASFIGYALVGFNVGFGIRMKGFDWGLYHGVSALASGILTVFVAAFIIDALAPSFGSEKNMGRSVQLVAYSWTPGFVAGLAMILPSLAILSIVGIIYGLYLLYVGLPKLKKTPTDKLVGYFVVSLITIIVVYFVLGFVLNKILAPIFGIPDISDVSGFRL